MIDSLKQQQPVKKRRKKKLKTRSAEASAKVPRRDRGRDKERDSRAGDKSHRHPFPAILITAASALTLLALVSEAGPRWAGPFGHKLAVALLRPLGLLSFTLPLAGGVGAAMLLGLVKPSLGFLKQTVSILGGIAASLAFLAIVTPTFALLGFPVAGAALASLTAPVGAALSVVGGGILTGAIAFACLSVASGHALTRATLAWMALSGRGLQASSRWAASAAKTAIDEHRAARLAAANSFIDEPSVRGEGEEDALDEELLDAAVAEEADRRSQVLTRTSLRGEAIPVAEEDVEEVDADDPADQEHETFQIPEILTVGEDGRIRNGNAKPEVAPIALGNADLLSLSPPPPPAGALMETPVDPSSPQAEETTAPQIVEVHDPLPKKKKRGAFELQRTGGAFNLPGLDLLEVPPDIHQDIDRDALTETAQKLTQKLADFGIKGRVETIRPGPVITMYEFVPAPGIRVSKIASLADDLAMAMEALQVRIVAPIPGKSVVGIEVPNRQRSKVHLREVLEDDGFAKMTSPLTLAFGKDTEGQPYVGDLSRMPHLLVAGTTGSGKSVSMNSMIMSLLFKASPEDVRFIMIDPKMVELSMYDGIPHLLLPVVQDAQKAPLALRWAVDEMERRYQLIGKLKVKDLKAYNEKVARLKKGEKLEEVAVEPPKKVLVVDVSNGETEEEALARLAQQGSEPEPNYQASAPATGIDVDELEKLPYIVIIIDELADLMMVASRDVEQCIARIAAKARAAGIHLVIATQRPSTDVISGVIKSNLPVRIAFRLASRHDSATIINGPGAERLLGEGDMLHIPPGCSDPLRLHGAWVRESEIERVVDFWKAQGKPVYDEEILKPRGDEREANAEDNVPDELYDLALATVAQLERVSISLLQRKMGVGYNRAADLIERLERDGAIGPANGIKPREVLIKPVGEARL